MSNYLILIIAALTAVPIVFGILLGLLRGSRRALLRLILIVVCAVVAFIACGALTDIAIETDIAQFMPEVEGPMTVVDWLTQQLGEDLAALGDFIVPIAQSLIKVIMFLVLFFVLWLLTWLIVYPLCKLFVKPKKAYDSRGRLIKKRHRLLGAGIGLVQGVVVAVCVCIVFNGLFAVSGDLIQAADGLSAIAEESQPAQQSEEGGQDDEFAALKEIIAMMEEYNESTFAKLYGKIGSKPFEYLSSVKVDEDKTITLSGQSKALRGLVDIAQEFLKITELDLENMTESTVDDIMAILKNVQDIKKALPEEANDTVNSLLTTLSDTIGFNLSFVTKIDDLNIANETAALKTFVRYADQDFTTMDEDEIRQAAEDLISSIGNSDVLMDVLDEVLVDYDIDLGSMLDEELLSEIDSTLDDMVQDGTISQESVDRLRDLLGLN